MPADYPQLTALLARLRLLSEQARHYERILPPDDYTARAAVAALAALAWDAISEANDLAATLAQPPTPAAGNPLTPREGQVLALVASGLTNREIAYRLGLSDRTVQFHLNGVFNKTGASSRTEAVTIAIRKGWLVP